MRFQTMSVDVSELDTQHQAIAVPLALLGSQSTTCLTAMEQT